MPGVGQGVLHEMSVSLARKRQRRDEGRKPKLLARRLEERRLTVDPDTFASLRNMWHLAFYRIALETLTPRIIRRLCILDLRKMRGL